MKSQAFANVALALLGSTLLVPAAIAQNADAPLMSVYERQRADYDAAGVRSGSFLFKPSVNVEGKFDSNIYAAGENEVDDFIAIIKPSLKLDSDWSSHAFSLFADGAIAKYSDNSGEEYTDVNVGASGRLDVTRGSSIDYSLSYSAGHEDRGAADDIGAPADPTEFSLLNASVGFKRDEGLVSFAVDGKYVVQDYDDAALIGGGFVENDDRDRDTVSGSVRLGYHLNDEYEAFVKFTAVKVTYDDSTIEGGPRRDSDGWDAVGGMAFQLSGASEGDFFVGYVKRDFDAASLGDVSDFTFGASVLWAPTGLTSARLAVSRNVVETTLRAANSDGVTVAAAGTLTTAYSLRVEHELQRNFLLNANVSFSQSDYVGTVRDDDITKAGFGAKYLMNRNVALNADYVLEKRNTTEAGQDYTRNTVMVSLTAQW
ncbi:MAG: outer membrane beta-barrel protein [Kordiimonadaceae bacterium]|nr:outer membrane beta-barrel protein [Kordiimonadaceae bacterium]